MEGIVGYRAKEGEVWSSLLVKHALVAGDVYYLTDETAGIGIVASELAFKGEGELTYYGRVDECALFGREARYLKLILYVISRSYTDVVALGDMIGISHTDSEGTAIIIMEPTHSLTCSQASAQASRQS